RSARTRRHEPYGPAAHTDRVPARTRWPYEHAAHRAPTRGSAARVAQDLADDVTAGDAGHPTAAVRGAAGLVQAPDRRAQVGVAGGGAAVEQLARAQLAV